jgi:hypothetical protein
MITTEIYQLTIIIAFRPSLAYSLGLSQLKLTSIRLFPENNLPSQNKVHRSPLGCFQIIP